MSDWRSDLDAFLATKEQQQQEHDRKLEASKALLAPFVEDKLLPALGEVKAALERHGRRVVIHTNISPVWSSVAFSVSHDDNVELDCQIVVADNAGSSIPVSISAYRHVGSSDWPSAHPLFLDADASNITQDNIIQSVLEAYKQGRG